MLTAAGSVFKAEVCHFCTTGITQAELQKTHVFKEDSSTCSPVRMDCIKSYLILHMIVTQILPLYLL